MGHHRKSGGGHGGILKNIFGMKSHGKSSGDHNRKYQEPQTEISGSSIRNCQSCQAPNPIDAKFCTSCGTKLQEQTSFCNQCGANLAPGTKFCSNCGATV